MKLSTRKHNDKIHIIDINGHVDASNAMDLEKEFDKVITHGNNNIIVNFKNVNYISSAGLRVFLTSIKKIQNQNGNMILCEMSPNVYKIFKIAGFIQIFKILKTETESLQNIN